MKEQEDLNRLGWKEQYSEGYLIAQTFEEAIWTPTTKEALCTNALIGGVQMGLSHKREQLASELKCSLFGIPFQIVGQWHHIDHKYIMCSFFCSWLLYRN